MSSIATKWPPNWVLGGTRHGTRGLYVILKQSHISSPWIRRVTLSALVQCSNILFPPSKVSQCSVA